MHCACLLVYLRSPTLHDKKPHQPCLPRPPQARLSVAEVRQAGGQAEREVCGDTILMVAVRREGQTRDANPPQSSRLADHEHRFLIRRTQSGLRRIGGPTRPIHPFIEPSSRASGGDPHHRGTSVELQDLNASRPPLPARATNKEKPAVLVTSLPPVLCWLCPEVGGRVDASHPRRCVHAGWGRSPLYL